MAPGRAGGQRLELSQLWQMPLLCISVGLFAVATYLFLDLKPRMTIDQKIDVARVYLRQGRPEAAIESLNKLLLDSPKLERTKEGQIHLLLAQGLYDAQRQRRIDIPANQQRVIEQTRLGLAQGAVGDAETFVRRAEAYESLGQTQEALTDYRQAIAMDAGRAVSLQKRMIGIEVDQGRSADAEAQLAQYVQNKELTDAERAWAMGLRAQILIDRGNYAEAQNLLRSALKLELDQVGQGELNYRLGYCSYKLMDMPEAERYLRVARDQLRVQHPNDADAAYLLGRIYQDRRDPQTATSFYQAVLTSHPESAVAPLARLGRGLCRIMQDQDDAGLGDLQELVRQLSSRPSKFKCRPEAVEGLRAAASMLSQADNYQGVLEVMADEQEIEPHPDGPFFARLGVVYERRADQLEQSIADARPAEQAKRSQQVRELRAKAGDAWIAYSRALTLADDKGYGEAMWRGIDLYDRAADVQRVVAALEVFIAERPEDPLTPEALLRLGRAYQAAGMLDKAIAAYQRNQFRYPQSLAASKSAVPLAEAYVAKGPDYYVKAEQVLLGVVQNNPLLTPEAQEFRQALFELGQLYYRTGRYEEAVVRLEEWTQRYPNDSRLPQLVFLMGDSYRKSAGLLEAQLAGGRQGAASGSGTVADRPSTQPTTADSMSTDVAEAIAARQQRLAKARDLFDRAVDLYGAHPPDNEVDRMYLKLSCFYRADCVFDLGNYDEAVRLYDAAALRYQDDPSALAAQVQIVNAYCAMGKLAEARTANERAKWLLRKMPASAFQDGSFEMPKQYWEQWMSWTSNAGLW